MEQHPVPQDITGFQFKLIGDMTVKQFVYLAGGLVVAFIIYHLNIIVFVKYPLLALFAGGGAALAFLDVDKRPLDRIVASFFRSVYRDTRYIWKKSPQVPEILEQSSFFAPPPTSQTNIPSTPNKQKLEEFLHSLPQKPKTNIDKIEEQKLNLVLSNFKNLPFKKNLNIRPEIKTPPTPYNPPHQTPIIPLASGHQTDTVIYPGQKIHFKPITDVRVRKLGLPPAPQITPQVVPFVKKAAPQQIKPHPVSAKDYVVADQSGKLEKSTPIKKTVYIAPRTNTPPPLKTPTNPEEQKIFDLSQKNQALENQMKNIQTQVDKLRNEPLSPNTSAADFDRTLKDLLNSLRETERERQSAVSELIKLRRKLDAQKNVVSPSLAPDEKPSVRFVSPTTAKKVGLPVIDYAPNVINGIVVEPNGNVLPSVVMVVKDQKDNPVRAFKSNRLGQFSIATPLPSGTYIVEVEKEGFDFDIIKLELKGEPLPPIEIKARPEPKPEQNQNV